MTFIALLLAATLLPPAAEPVQVAVLRDGRSVLVKAPMSAEQRAQIAGVWSWSATQPPKRSDGLTSLAAERPTAPRLAVHLALPRGMKPSKVVAIAAPRRMWSEVDEQLLPSFDVGEATELRIPIDTAAPWRLRVNAAGLGSWWYDVLPGEKSVTIALHRATPVELSLLMPDGKAATNAVITVSRAADPRSRATLARRSADEKGVVAYGPIPPSEPVSVIINTPSTAPFTYTGMLQQLPARVTLPKGATLHGECVDGGGKPVAKASVTVESWLDSAATTTFRRETVSDAKGRWKIASLPTGAAVVVARAEGYAAESRQLQVQHDERLEPLVMQKGMSTRLRVLDDRGEPARNVTIQSQGIGARSTTDDGTATLLLPAGRETELRLSGAGYVTATARVIADAKKPEIDVTISRSLSLRGFVRDEHGNAPANVTLKSVNGTREITHDGVGGDGAFICDIAPDTEVTLIVASPTTETARVTVSAGNAGEIRDVGTITLTSGLTVTGRVISDDGSPVADARIWSVRGAAKAAVVAWARGDTVQTVTASDGTFRLRGLARQPAVLRVDAPAFARQHVPITPDPEGDLALGDVRLGRGAELRIIAPDSDEPLVARVDLQQQRRELDVLSASVVGREAIFRNVSPGTVLVSLLRNERTVCEQIVELSDAARETVDCRRPPRHVRGVVLTGSERANGGWLTWSAPRGEPTEAIISNTVSRLGAVSTRVMGAGPAPLTVTVAADGSFRTDELLPGRWRVDWMLPSGAIVEAPEPITVSDTSDTFVELRFPGTMIAGRVEHRGGKPAAGAIVQDVTSRSSTITSPDGTFELPLSPELHELRAQAGELASSVVTVDPRVRRTEPLVLTLVPNENVLTIEVSDRSGAASGAFVFLETDRGTKLLTTSTSGKVDAHFGVLPATLRAAAYHQGRWSFGETRQLEAGVPLRLHIGATGSLRVEQSVRTLTAPSGWDVLALLRQLGSSVGESLTLSGLPAGQYAVQTATKFVTVTIREDAVTEVRD